jgi:hypothetical protein
MLLISVRLTVLSGGRETPAEYRRAEEVPSIIALLLNMHVRFIISGGWLLVWNGQEAKELLPIKIGVELHTRMKCEGI